MQIEAVMDARLFYPQDGGQVPCSQEKLMHVDGLPSETLPNIMISCLIRARGVRKNAIIKYLTNACLCRENAYRTTLAHFETLAGRRPSSNGTLVCD
jgi:hypothetical protein